MMDGEVFKHIILEKKLEPKNIEKKQEEYNMRQILRLISTLITEYVYMDIYDLCIKNVEQLKPDVLQIIKKIFSYYNFYNHKITQKVE